MKSLREIAMIGIGVFLTYGCETSNIPESEKNNNYIERISAMDEDFGVEETQIPVKYNNPASKIKLAGYTQNIVELK